MDIPESLDWVTRRSECSLAAVFQALAEVLDSNVKTRNNLPHPPAVFRVNRPAAEKIVVVRERNFGGVVEAETVVFDLLKSGIAVTRKDARGSGSELFRASPSLNMSGECTLDVNGEELRLWQVSRVALEDLFFGF